MKYNVQAFGAKGDGKTNDAKSIQRAIDCCAENGGGQVVFPGGHIYNSGYILLKSNVDLHLEKGAILKGSDHINDYYPLANDGKIVDHHSGLPSFLNSEYAGRPFHAFICGFSEHNVTISGEGTIDANEKIFYGHDSGYHIEGQYYPRIPAILFEDFKQLTIRDITIKDCAFWTVHIIGCEDVNIDGIRILNNLKMANSDGIDPDHCKNVRISNCHIECGDDCIVLKNTGDYVQYGACENIVINNCTLISTSAAIKIGTEGESDFRNIFVNNCTVSRSNRGISIQIRDNGNVENVVFSNMSIETRRFSNEWWGRAEPITITALDRKEGIHSGKVRNITFENIFCVGENGIFLKGLEENPIQNIMLKNIHLTLKKTSKWDVEGYDIRPCQGDGAINGKITGVYSKGVRDLMIENVRVDVEDSMKIYYEKDVNIKVDNDEKE